MKKSLNGTFILLGIFAVLLGWYLIFEQKLRPDRDKKSEDAKHLVQLDRDAIQEIEIDRKKAGPAGSPITYETIKLKKSGSDWNLVAPVEDEADSATMGTLVATLTSTQTERTVDESPKDLAPFGLKEPAVKIRARKDSSSPWLEIKAGGDTNVGFNSYFQVGDKPAVLTANRNLKNTFEKEANALRNKKLLKVSRNDIDGIEVQSTRDSYVLSKTGDDWTLARTGMPADGGEVNRTLNALVDSKVKEFADPTGTQGAKFGLARPAATVTISQGKGKKKLTLLLGKTGDPKKGEKFYVKHSEKNEILEVEKDLADRLLKSAHDYRNLQLAKFNRFTLTKIRVEQKQDPVELRKKGTDWEVPGDGAFKVDGNAVDGLLTSLQDAKVADFLAPKSADADLKAPELVLRLFEKEGDKEVEKTTLTFAKRKNGQIVATRTGFAMPFAVKAEDFAKFNVGKKHFAKKAEEKKPEAKKADDNKTG